MPVAVAATAAAAAWLLYARNTRSERVGTRVAREGGGRVPAVTEDKSRGGKAAAAAATGWIDGLVTGTAIAAAKAAVVVDAGTSCRGIGAMSWVAERVRPRLAAAAGMLAVGATDV